jgi:uncharacterized protein (TIGR03437 family)
MQRRSRSLFLRLGLAVAGLILLVTLPVGGRIPVAEANPATAAPPVITAASALTRQQGAGFSTSGIATVSDSETAAGSLTVSASAPAGIAILDLSNDGGTVSASIAAGCNATPGSNTVVLTVTDGEHLTATANLTVNVTANTAPTIGAYQPATVFVNGNATLAPNAAPNDQGSFSILAVAPGFTGTLSLNQATGIITISNAGPVGTFAVTLMATDLCGASSSTSFTLTVLNNTPPIITVAPPISRIQGSSGTIGIAVISDAETAASSLTVTAVSVPAGLTISQIANDSGQITATMTAACDAAPGTNTVGLMVTDEGGLTATANLTVNVSQNLPPVLGTYPAKTANPGESVTVAPSAAPADNGSIVKVTAETGSGFTGALSVDKTSGVVTIGNAGPSGVHFISVTATDNCGVTTTNSFRLSVNFPLPVISGLSPSSAFGSGSAFTLTVNGSNFSGSSVVRWNGQDRATTFISATQLSAQLTVADLASPGTASVTVFTPEPGGGLSNAATFTINPPADLAVTQNISPNPVGPGGTVTFNLSVTNNGPGAASQVVVQDTPPEIVSFSNCAATNGGVCGAAGASRTVTFGSLAAGTTATITLTATVKCSILTGAIPSTPPLNTVSVSSSIPDQNPGNNSAAATLNVTPAQLRVTPGLSAIEFAPVAAAREPNPNPPSTTFSIENTGCVSLLVSFAVRRTGADVSSGKITGTDDSVTFPLRLINDDGSSAPVLTGQQYQVSGGQKLNFRLFFDPKIPAPAGRTTGLLAHQAIPDLITSSLILTPNAGSPVTVPITARVRSAVKLIHPIAPRLAPLVVLQKSGTDEFTVECSLHDPNLDASLIRYQFLDSSGSPILQPPDIELNLSSAGLARGQSVTVVNKFMAARNSPQPQRVQVIVYDGEANDAAVSAAIGTVPGRVVNVSAANFSPASLASESIAAAFGTNLSTATAAATTQPLPTRLGGARVFVTDSNQIEREAPLFFVSPLQINYLIPAGTAAGEAQVVVAGDDNSFSLSTIQVAPLAPSLFSANSNGTGVAAALALRVRANNSQSYEPVAEYDGAKFTARPLDFGPESDQLYLVLFGTGLRNRSDLSAVSARIGGTEAEVLYAGPQGAFAGLDQVNLKLPRTLAGRGETAIVLTVDGKPANVVRISFR